MKDSPAPSIAVADLRIGLFVHLDVGWMDHPFPLSSFKITSQQQIDTIRSLGVPSVRYSPDKSDPPEDTSQPVAAAAAAAPETPEQAAARAARAAAEQERQMRRAQLHEQKQALLLCEKGGADMARVKQHQHARPP